MTKILITGGAGYIGSTLTALLLEQGFHVTVLDNFMWGVPSLAHLCHKTNLDIIRGDCRDLRYYSNELASCDVFIPLAALVGAPLCDQDTLAAASTNFQAIEKAVAQLGRGQLVLYPNTNSGYGTGQGTSFCTEETPLKPISLYGRLKCDAEDAVLRRPYSVVFRLATVFGMSPRMRLDLLVNDFVYRAVTDRVVTLFEADFKRNYIHVRDVAAVFLHAIKNDLADGAYNVGLSTANLSKRELCNVIAARVPDFTYSESQFGMDPDKRNYVVSNDKIEATGYAPNVTLYQGIDELVKGFRMLKRYQHGNI